MMPEAPGREGQLRRGPGGGRAGHDDQPGRSLPTVLANRAFLVRSTSYLAGQADLRHFLDIGSGMPAGDNVHEVAQAAGSESRVVYVDHNHRVRIPLRP